MDVACDAIALLDHGQAARSRVRAHVVQEDRHLIGNLLVDQRVGLSEGVRRQQFVVCRVTLPPQIGRAPDGATAVGALMSAMAGLTSTLRVTTR